MDDWVIDGAPSIREILDWAATTAGGREVEIFVRADRASSWIRLAGSPADGGGDVHQISLYS